MKICCVYHSRDLDGWMSAAVVKLWHSTILNKFASATGEFEADKFYNSNIDLIGYDYGDPIPDLSLYDKVIMCDISFPVAEMDLIASRVDIIQRDFIWIDHHLSAIKECSFEIDGKYISGYGGIRDTNFAACELTWRFFFPDKQMPEIVRLLGRYDCFGHKGTAEEKTVLEFQYAARTYWTSPDHCYEALLHDDTRTVALFTEIGMGIHKYLCTEAKQIYSKRFDLLIDGYKFGCVNRERFNPINFGINYHSDGYDGFMCFWYDGKKYSYSLYNDNGQVDCSEIAKRRGGGGHKGASGFVIEMSIDTIKL